MATVARKALALVCLAVLLVGPVGSAVALAPMQGTDPRSDVDRDGLNTAQELMWGTDPNDPDSDGGGAYDGWEVWYETHRAVGDDGATPIISKEYQFDPNSAADEGVVAYPNMLLQLTDKDANPAINDPDNDGWNNHHEFLVGSDPTNPNTDGDQFVRDSTDPDPLVSNGNGEFPIGCVQDDHATQHPNESASNSNAGHSEGNGGGGSGIAEAIMMA